MKIYPFIEVAIDPKGTRTLVLSLSGMRQFREFLDDSILWFHKSLGENPEGENDLCQTSVTLGNTKVVMMTDDTLVKLMGMATKLAGLPGDFNPFIAKDTDGNVIEDHDTELPDWYMNLMNGNTTEDKDA